MAVSRMQFLKVPGEGDCFYHSLMMNIIHDVLADKISEESVTGNRIQKNLLPLIQKQLLLKSGDRLDLDFETKNLKQSILALLKAVPLPSSASLKASKADDESIATIKQCDLYHLLCDICGPALRNLMLEGTREDEEYNDLVKKLLADEFSAFIKFNYAKKLALDESTELAARILFQGGEFLGIPEELKKSLLQSWRRTYKRNQQQLVSAADKNLVLNELFENWWSKYSKSALKTYASFHQMPKIQAGKPQQLALTKQLHSNFVLEDRYSKSLSPILDFILDEAVTFSFSKSARCMHYDAVVSSTKISKALSDQTQLLHIGRRYEQLKKTSYVWHKASANSPSVKEPSINSSNSASTRCITETLEKKMDLIENEIKEVQALLRQQSKVIPKMQSFERHLLQAAQKGYGDFHAKIGLFAKSSDPLQQQRAKELLAVVHLQNKEIKKFFKK